MFSHVRVGATDIARSKAFYDAALAPLGIAPGQEMFGMYMWSDGTNNFAIGTPREGDVTHANGGTIGFHAKSEQAIADFHAAGLANGGTCEGEPGPRGGGAMHAAYLRDPDGNKICAIKMG